MFSEIQRRLILIMFLRAFTYQRKPKQSKPIISVIIIVNVNV